MPVGGVLIAERFTEPLSGRVMRNGGASMRAGQLIPSPGGYQALLESKVQWDKRLFGYVQGQYTQLKFEVL